MGCIDLCLLYSLEVSSLNKTKHLQAKAQRLEIKKKKVTITDLGLWDLVMDTILPHGP